MASTSPQSPTPRTRGETTLDSPILGRTPELIIAFLVSAAFGASFGFNYGIDNQVTYLLKSLAIVEPDILHKDWFLHGVTQYHPAFADLGVALIALDPSGWLVALLNALVITACCLF